MANDPNRDLLPVKDIDDRSTKGINCRVDLNIVGKLKRCDLEDRYMRLYEENTQIKKQLNSQDEKIKRLGTKLLRLIGEKKSCQDCSKRKQPDGKELDEFQMRIIELEHENYILKDRNVVLKQQLANHARQHVAAHRSPNRSVHNSPRISHRQSSAPNVNESNYMISNRNQPQDVQLKEAEEHINGLNEEIRTLHNKIDTLQQDLEKSCLENQKTKVSENIELIRLQRSLKQQSIQIATLQAQIKNSEKNQKLLRDELAAAHKENEESLLVISEKQKEILVLYTRLEEKNVTRLEREEMKERINDLTSERDSLRQRGEFLMKTIEEKSSETEIINDLKKLLSAEKAKKEELKLSLENTQKLLQSLKESTKLSQSSDEALVGSSSAEDTTKTARMQMTVSTQTTPEPSRSPMSSKSRESELELLNLTQLHSSDERGSQNCSKNESKGFINNNETKKSVTTSTVGTLTENARGCHCSEFVRKEIAVQAQPRDNSFLDTESELSAERAESKRACEAEKLNLERELEYVKQMLRSQTQRCEAQEEEISHLNSELHVCEGKYSDTLKRLDLHLKIFRHLESRTSKVYSESDSDVIERKYLSLLATFDDPATEGQKEDRAQSELQSARASEVVEEIVDDDKMKKKKDVNSRTSTTERGSSVESEKRRSDKEGRLRFMQRKYLISSDEDEEDESTEQKDLVWLADERRSTIKKEVNESPKIIASKKSPRKSKTHECDSSSSNSHLGAAKARRKTDPKKSFMKDEIEVIDTSKIPQNAARRLGMAESDNSYFNSQLGLIALRCKNQEEARPVAKPRTEFLKNGGSSGTKARSPGYSEKLIPGTTVTICIEWLKLEPETSVWYNDNVRLLFIDFSFLDVKGEETETPSSLRKPKKPVEKCHYNFNKGVEINNYRASALQAMRSKPDQEVIVFKIVSEPEDSSDDIECVDIGVAIVTVKQFFESQPNTSVLLPVKNIIDMKEIIGILSVRLDFRR